MSMIRCRTESVNNGRLAVKLTAMAVCAFFLLAIVLSSVFILANANHEHDHNGEGGGCATCTSIAACSKLIEHLGAAATVAAAIAVMAGFSILPQFTASQTNAGNLVSLKVRLNI